MEKMTTPSLILLKQYKSRLTKQQYKTFKGQILKGDFVGFKKGLKKVLEVEKWKHIAKTITTNYIKAIC